MINVKIYDKSKDILWGDFDIVVAPCNDSLSVNGVHARIPYVISEHFYLLDKQYRIRENNPNIKSGDTFIVRNENKEQADLLYAVLALASATEQKNQLTVYYRNIFQKAQEVGAKTVRIPSISEGVFGYDPKLAVDIGLEIASEFKLFSEISFYCYNDSYFTLLTEGLTSY